jgi:hypothetical protein
VYDAKRQSREVDDVAHRCDRIVGDRKDENLWFATLDVDELNERFDSVGVSTVNRSDCVTGAGCGDYKRTTGSTGPVQSNVHVVPILWVSVRRQMIVGAQPDSGSFVSRW